MTFSAVNTIWVLLGAALVFFMQAGFAMCEAGFTRAKNTGNILMKNLMDFCIGTPLYWLFGFGIMFGTGTAVFGWIDPFIMKEYGAVLDEARAEILNKVDDAYKEHKKRGAVEKIMVDTLKSFIYKKTNRSPVIVPVFMEV